MSSLLEQAIIDAKTLKETARRNAEAAILEKYSSKIKQSIETLLEQEEVTPELDLGTTPDLSAGASSEASKKIVEKVPPAYLGENNMEEIDLDLDSLVEKVDVMKKQLNIADVEPTQVSKPAPSQPTTRIATDTLAEATEEESMEEAVEQESVEEAFEVGEELQEEIHLDMQVVTPGGLQGNQIETNKQMAVAKALAAQLEDLKEHLGNKDAEIENLQEQLSVALLENQTSKKSLSETKDKLKKSLSINLHLKENFEQFSKKINEVNLINARLLYSNKALRNASLNERQRDQIAEAISQASSVDEAKTVYETLQKSMQTVVEKRTAPQSLSEALNKTSSAFLPRKTTPADSSMDRWKILAGIKK